MKKRLGIMGGLGPLASALFMEQLTLLTEAARDQDHIDCILYSAASVPDRSAYLCGEERESPLPALIFVRDTLAPLCDLIAMPCVTAHCFYDALCEGLNIPFVDMCAVCADAAAQTGVRHLGILATPGTRRAGRLESILAARGIQCVWPDEHTQEWVTALIYGVKTGAAPDWTCFASLCDTLAADGAERILLACTELSLFVRQHTERALCRDYPNVMDASALLAKHCVAAAGGKTGCAR